MKLKEKLLQELCESFQIGTCMSGEEMYLAGITKGVELCSITLKKMMDNSLNNADEQYALSSAHRIVKYLVEEET